MIKLTYCLRRRSDLTWEQFSDYWREVHAPLVAERADTLGIRRYLQIRTMQDRPLIEGMRARNGASPNRSTVSPSCGSTRSSRSVPSRPKAARRPPNCSPTSATSSTSNGRRSGLVPSR